MAAWQADFNVILTGPLPPDYREQIRAVLPPGKSWSPALETWGVEDGDRIDVVTDAEPPPGVSARFDLRTWKPALYDTFLWCCTSVLGLSGRKSKRMCLCR
jgi:hypothetical protein